VLWTLRTGLERLVATDLALRRRELDALHRMRVACRRLRSDVRTFARILEDARADALREELAWLSGSLGDARELEVLRVRVLRTAQRDKLYPIDRVGLAELRRRLADEEKVALEAVRTAIASGRYVELLKLVVAMATEPELGAGATQPCREVLPHIVGASWRHLAKRAGRLQLSDPDSDWHRARILAKRVRYAAEVATVALGKDAKATARAATKVQEVLGEHQDAAVAADRILAMAALPGQDSTFVVTCGRLAERERAGLLATRASFPEIWHDAKGGRATRWLAG
jgi:CHAD domain-containing protein